MADFVIGLDAGGTHTRAAAYAIPGDFPAPNAVSVTGCGNLALDPDSAADAIFSAASEVIRTMKERGFGDCRAILCGAAGSTSTVGTISAAEFCRRRLLPLCTTVTVVSDGELALLAAFGESEDGLLAVSGTGSIVYLRNAGKVTRAGGWGHLLGDGGSGWSLAQTGLKLLLAGVDSGAEDSELKEAVFRFLEINSLSQLVGFVYGNPKSAVASLAPTVEALAEAGNSTALEAVRRSAGELVSDALHLLGQLGDEKPAFLPLCLSGGCFEHLPLLRRCFLDELREAAPLPLILRPTPDATSAALRIQSYQI